MEDLAKKIAELQEALELLDHHTEASKVIANKIDEYTRMLSLQKAVKGEME